MRPNHHSPARFLAMARPAAIAIGVTAFVACGGGKNESTLNGSANTTATSAVVPAAAPSTTAATTPAAATGPTTPVAAPAKAGAVTISNFAFSPAELTVPAGTTVTWTNQDDTNHSIMDTSAMHTPVSKNLAKGDTFSITYPKAGSYSYICGIHNYMMGTVTVR